MKQSRTTKAPPPFLFLLAPALASGNPILPAGFPSALASIAAAPCGAARLVGPVPGLTLADSPDRCCGGDVTSAVDPTLLWSLPAREGPRTRAHESPARFAMDRRFRAAH